MISPGITAILPVKNGAQWVNRSLTNIIRNLQPTDELIIIDDGSIDDTEELIKVFGESFPLMMVKNPGSGLVDALNYGIKLSNNEWVARFDIDDVYDETRIQQQRALITSESSAIFSDYTIRSSEGVHLGRIPSAVFHGAISASLINSQRTPHPSALFSKMKFNLVGGYRSQDFPAEDLSLWIRLSKVGSLASVPFPLLRYTLHTQSVSAVNYQLAKEKHLALFREFEFGPREAQGSFATLESNLQEYLNFPDSQLRSAMLLGDLYKATVLGFIPKSIRKTLLACFIELTKEGGLEKSLASALFYKFKRENVRRRGQSKRYLDL